MSKKRGFKSGKKKIPKKGNLKKGKQFWDEEYASKDHLKISDNPSSDMVKFYRWLEKQDPYFLPYKDGSVLDIGCGNGRNIIATCSEFGCHGVGYDISSEAIEQCKEKTKKLGLDIDFHTQNASEAIPLGDESQKVVLDMMVSHVLKNEDKENLIKEIHRVLEPSGFLFLKTFLLDGDINAKILLRDYPGSEEGFIQKIS
jgi:SAM-dependent methyltransferase